MRRRYRPFPKRESMPGIISLLVHWAVLAASWSVPVIAVEVAADGSDRGISITTPAPAGDLSPLVQRLPALQFELEALRPSVAVGEPIRLRVRGNRPSYIYLYNIDKVRGEAVLLFPNRRQRDNRYRPGRGLVLPAPGVEFVADAPGLEHLLLVATSRPMHIEPSAYRSLGLYTSTSRQAMESALASRGIEISDPTRPPARDVAVRELDLAVRPDTYPSAPRALAPSTIGSLP